MSQDLKHNQHRKWLTKVTLISLLLILLLLISCVGYAKQVTVHTDHQQVQMGDIITLIVETDFSPQSSPDFTQMQDQFDLLGNQRSNQIQIINANYQSLSRWILHISPKQIGELVIPPLEVDGILSQPLIINVSDTQHAPGEKRGSSFLESTLNLTQVYVQQEVLFTLRFYHQGRFIDGNIRPPVFEDALSEPLQNQFHYQTQIEGKRYDVYQWTWAFYPQKSGDVVIPPQAFYGRIQYQGRLKQVKEQTDPLILTVKPKPANYPPQAAWLPAQSLKLTEDWQINQPIHVGDAISRTLKLSAQGLLHSQLPVWQLSNQSGFHLYPDPEQSNNQITSQGINSQKTVDIAIVATQAGHLTLPQIELHWWNTATDQLETATLPAKTLTILPAKADETGQVAQTPNNDSRETFSKETTRHSETLGWQIAVGALMGLWFLTVMGFIFWIVKLQSQLKKQTVEAVKSTKNNQAWSNLAPEIANLCDKTLAEKDAKSVFVALLTWKNHHPNLSSNALNRQLDALKAHLYGQAPLEPSLLTEVCQEVKRLSDTQPPKAAEKNRLAPIYPTQQTE